MPLCICIAKPSVGGRRPTTEAGGDGVCRDSKSADYEAGDDAHGPAHSSAISRARGRHGGMVTRLGVAAGLSWLMWVDVDDEVGIVPCLSVRVGRRAGLIGAATHPGPALGPLHNPTETLLPYFCSGETDS